MTAIRTKIDCCNGCTKRQADPNCHGYCKDYLEQRKELDESRAYGTKIYEVNAGIAGQRYDSIHKATKRRNYRSKYRRSR